jgi:uncharacterized integral membrane protein
MMNEHDRKLAEALLADDAALLSGDAPDESVLKDVAGTFRGKRAIFTWFAWFWGFVFAVLMIYAGYRYFTESAVNDLGTKLNWGLVCVLSMVANAMIKIWAWMEIQRVGVQRELKRIELRVALLGGGGGTDS